MQFIEQWLSGLGLDYIIPKLKDNGITTPKKLSALSLKDMYEILGIESADDRKKLYYLIQRLVTIINKDKPSKSASDDDSQRDFYATSSSSRDLISADDECFSEVASTVDESARVGALSPSSKGRSPSRSAKSHIPTPQKRDHHDNQHDDEHLTPDKTDRAAARSIFRMHSPKSPEERPSSRPFKSGIPTSAKKEPPTSTEHTLHTSEEVASSVSPAISPSHGKEISPKMDRLSSFRLKAASIIDSTSPTKVSPSSSTKSSLLQPKRAISAASSKSSLLKSSASFREKAANIKNKYNVNDTDGQISIEPSYSSDLIDSAKTRSKSVNLGRLSIHAGISYDAEQVPDIASSPWTKEGFSPAHRRTSVTSPKRIASSTTSASVVDQIVERSASPVPSFDVDEDEVMDMAIRVVVRKRPISKSELNKGDKDCLEVQRKGRVLVHEPKLKLDMTKYIETWPFKFDDAFEADETNEDIYQRTVKHLLTTVFEGGKASCFAYGQTGSGKTFTMMGSNPANPADVTHNAGLYVLVARDIFEQLGMRDNMHLKLYVSCFEIYGGKLFDLLNERSAVKCLEDSKGVVQTPGLSEHLVDDVEHLLRLMALAHGQRSTGSTGANLESSRSHQILQLRVKDTTVDPFSAKKKPVVNLGQFSFIDLAGSERGADTNTNSKQTRMEGAEINTSLLALKEVIRSLEKKNGFTPFRGSKLTQVLKDSFVGENTRTCMVACVSPAYSNSEHTLNTLRYADRVKEHQSSGEDPPSTDSAGPAVKTVQLRSKSPRRPDISPTKESSSASSKELSSTPSKTFLTRDATKYGTKPFKSAQQSSHPTGSQSQSPSPAVQESTSRPVSQKSAVSPVKDTLEDVLSKKISTLIGTHKRALGDFVESMTAEMVLVGTMESDDRDVEEYIFALDELLDRKQQAVQSLRTEIGRFQLYRSIEIAGAGK